MRIITRLKKTSILIIFLFLLGMSFMAKAQVAQEWAKVFNQKFEDNPTGIAIGSNGNIYVAGRSGGDFAVMCYSPQGDSLASEIISAYGAPAAGALIVDDSNYVYITGYDYASWPTSSQAYTIKFDPFRQLNGGWSRKLSESSLGNAITIDNQSNVYITGESLWTNIFVVKYNKKGIFQWESTLNFGFYDTGIDIEVDNDLNSYVLAKSTNQSNSHQDFMLIKYNADGDTLWTRRYNGNGSDNVPVKLKLDKAGNAYVSGYIYTGLDAREDFATLKYDPSGNLKWVATYNGPASYTDRVTDMCIDDSANVYVAGTSTADNLEVAVIKYDSSGRQKWTGHFAGYVNNAGQICTDKNGNVYATGIVTPSVSDDNIVTLKFDRNGDLKWNIEYGSADSLWDRPAGIVADTAGNIYVIGNSGSATPGNSYDWVTIKYSQEMTGNLKPVAAKGISSFKIYPNPAFDKVAITWQQSENSHVLLTVYDFAGKPIATLVDSEQPMGEHQVAFNASGLLPGVYLCQLKTAQYFQTKKILLTK